MIFRKEYILGLDIGTSSIKTALFRKNQDGLLLSRLKVIEISRETRGAIALGEALSDIGVNIKNCETVTVINSGQVMVKRIIVPPMPYDELREAVILEAKNYFPFPVIDSLVDFQIIGEVVEKGIRKTEVIVGVCPSQLMREHLHLLALSGVRPSRAIHPGIALYNLLRIKGLKDGLSIAALDIGKSFCDLIIVKSGKLSFSRKIPICADDFTKAATGVLSSVSGKVQFSYEEAEKAKKERGLIPDGGHEPIEGKITSSQLFSLLRPQGERLANEIERSFDFYREEAGVSKVDKLILFGGGARLKGLDRFLSEGLSMEVEIFSSLEWIGAEEGLSAGGMEINRLAAAVGAGLSGAAGINLLPPEVKQEAHKAVRRAAFEAALSAAITIALLLLAGMRIHLSGIHKKIAAARLELSALEQSFGSPEDWVLMHKVVEYEPYYEDVLKEISNVIPDNIYLKEIKMEKRSLALAGIILSLKNPEETLSGFIHSLEAGIFRNVRFARIESAPGAKEFLLRMDIE